jgi:hypothetical protein
MCFAGFVPDGAICRQQIGVVVSARAIFAEVSGDAGTEVATKIELHRRKTSRPTGCLSRAAADADDIVGSQLCG